jgi:hypothetical protein
MTPEVRRARILELLRLAASIPKRPKDDRKEDRGDGPIIDGTADP